MAEAGGIQGYQDVPEEDRKKAEVFFGHGKAQADKGSFDYAITMYLDGLRLDPEAIDSHQALRDISLRRKVTGGKDLGMFDKMKLKKPSRDDKENLIAAEKLLSYDPGNTDVMLSLMQAAHRAGYYDTVLWIGPILQKANGESGKPDVNKYLILKDVYKSLGRWKEAADAAALAAQMRPDDMDLQREVKDIAAQQTMHQGNYAAGGSFRDSIRNRDLQQKLMNQDKDFQDADVQSQIIRDAEEQWKADPNEAGKLMKLVDALVKTENPDHENRAVELLQQTFDRTKQYRFRMAIGDIHMRQFSRMERGKREALKANPKDEALRKDYIDFKKEQTEFELNEFKERIEAYPTETKFRYEVGRRQFELGQFDEAIPTLQQSRNDPKYRYKASVILGRAFLEANYLDEADDTFAEIINNYQLRGDADSKEMYYWRARTLEKKNSPQDAIKLYSQVAQWDFNYRDVQARIKALRAAAAGSGGGGGK